MISLELCEICLIFIIRKTICSTIVKRSDVFSKRNVFFLFPLHYKNNVIIIAF